MGWRKKHILLVEPYYGGSHKHFLDGLTRHVDMTFTFLTLPARKWKMRMQTAAPWMAVRIIRLHRGGVHFDAILCSSFIDIAVLKSLLAGAEVPVPVAVYFHENQFAYPSQVHDPGRYQFTCINWTSGLTADRLYFNSRFNVDSYLDGIKLFLKKAADVDLPGVVESIADKSTVLYPGIDFSDLEQTPSAHCLCREPVIVWNHRWEHDKNPLIFFQALFELQDRNIPFRLIVLGENFRNRPGIFAEAEKRLRSRILHFGYVESRDKYCRLLGRGDIVVSTARHEFFGIAVLEAVYAGCRPLVPARLSYPELYPEDYLYEEDSPAASLQKILKKQSGAARARHRELARRFSWSVVGRAYEQELLRLAGKGGSELDKAEILR